MKKTSTTKNSILEDKNPVFIIFNYLYPYEIVRLSRVSKSFEKLSIDFKTDSSMSGRYLNQVAININFQQNILIDSENSLQKLVFILKTFPDYILENHASKFVILIAIQTLLPFVPQNTSWEYFNAAVKFLYKATNIRYIAIGGFISSMGAFLYHKGFIHIKSRVVYQQVNELKGYMNHVFWKLYHPRAAEEKTSALFESKKNS